MSDTEQYRAGFEAWAVGPDGPWTPRVLKNRIGTGYGNPELQIQWDCWTAAKREASTEPSALPVAYAVTAVRGGIHKLAITRESAERKAAKWQEEWPNNGCRVRPLAFADGAAGALTDDAEGKP